MGDLYLFLNLVIPPNFKIPEFKKCGRKTLPFLQLTMYTCSMVAYIGNEKLIVHYFSTVWLDLLYTGFYS